jgi:hypothetical protein
MLIIRAFLLIVTAMSGDLPNLACWSTFQDIAHVAHHDE